MIHYPKQILSEINSFESSLKQEEDLFRSYQTKLTTHFNNFLTCKKMVEYVLRTTGHWNKINSVLFIDSNLPFVPDYLSVLFLIGLKQTFGKDCEVLFPVDYIYQDTLIDTNNLYGRGFSYSKVLSPNLRTENEEKRIEENEPVLKDLFQKKFDLIVYGSVTRCLKFITSVKDIYAPFEIIGLHGEDIYPSSDYRNQIKHQLKQEMFLFVREMEEFA